VFARSCARRPERSSSPFVSRAHRTRDRLVPFKSTRVRREHDPGGLVHDRRTVEAVADAPGALEPVEVAAMGEV